MSNEEAIRNKKMEEVHRYKLDNGNLVLSDGSSLYSVVSVEIMNGRYVKLPILLKEVKND